MLGIKLGLISMSLNLVRGMGGDVSLLIKLLVILLGNNVCKLLVFKDVDGEDVFVKCLKGGVEGIVGWVDFGIMINRK